MYFFLLTAPPPHPILRSLSAPCVSPLIRPSLPQAKKKKKILLAKRIKALKVGLPELFSSRPLPQGWWRKAPPGTGRVSRRRAHAARPRWGPQELRVTSVPSLQPIQFQFQAAQPSLPLVSEEGLT